ncbi:MAG: hypothetical protein WDZ83_10100 [Rhizobiaceae bacterium]
MDATGIRNDSNSSLAIPRGQSRMRLVRRVVLLQVKLLADGLRDFVMMPLSLAAAVLGILSQRRDPELYLDRLMYFGRQTDRWINLFDHDDPDSPERRAPLDRVAEEIEATILRDYENGGLSARGAARLSELVARLRRGR